MGLRMRHSTDPTGQTLATQPGGVPKGRHPVGAAEGCGPQVRELGLRGAGNHVVRPLLAQPGGRRKASPLGSRP